MSVSVYVSLCMFVYLSVSSYTCIYTIILSLLYHLRSKDSEAIPGNELPEGFFDDPKVDAKVMLY